ncbi:MAG: serine/threonine protein phosphatase [Alphaproteobacteria bacterium]|nr:serine/threonine protein phosphatase [Alphaproteobacteria bacterium]
MFGRRRPIAKPPPRGLPSLQPGHRAYVIGDIHGRADLLAELLAVIKADAMLRPGPGKNVIVYLGDFVDRGPQSREVIDLILSDPLPDFAEVRLLGNHDETLLRFLGDPQIGPTWSSYGGDATLLSYGVRAKPRLRGLDRYEDMRRQLLELMPPEHVEFLQTLVLSCTAGDYLFVHAGVRPGVPIDRQAPADLLWIRDEFIESPQDFGAVVVHGHTPFQQPDVRYNRIGIDTNAFASGVLTCLILEGTDRHFLFTGAEQSAPDEAA